MMFTTLIRKYANVGRYTLLILLLMVISLPLYSAEHSVEPLNPHGTVIDYYRYRLYQLTEEEAIAQGRPMYYAELYQDSWEVSDETYYERYNWWENEHYALLYVSRDSVLTLASSVTYKGIKYTVIGITCRVESSGGFFRCVPIFNRVVLPDSLEYIEGVAFQQCNNLKYVDLPPTLKTIGENVFQGCNLSSVCLGENVRTIGKYAFSSNKSLKTLHIPSSVISIGSADIYGDEVGAAFSRCTSLEEITVDPQNPYYDSREDCNAIIETSSNKLILGCGNTFIPETVTSLGSYAFYGSQILNVTIPQGVIAVGAGCFSISSINSISIPSSVTFIGKRSFDYCEGLNSIVVDVDNSIYDSRNNCNSLIETSSNTLIAGSNNSQIPDGVKSLAVQAFSGRQISSITLPNSIIYLGSHAFYSCDKLETIRSKITDLSKVEIENACFSALPTSCVLKVPKGTIDAYRNTIPWSWFTIIEEWVDEVVGDLNADGAADGIDLNMIINIVLGKDDSNYDGRADMDGNGSVDGDDINQMINILLGK